MLGIPSLVPGAERSVFVRTKDLVRAEAHRNNVVLHCVRGVHELRTTLDALEQRLDRAQFARVNRSHLIRIDAIAELQPWFHRRYVTRRPDLLERA